MSLIADVREVYSSIDGARLEMVDGIGGESKFIIRNLKKGGIEIETLEANGKRFTQKVHDMLFSKWVANQEKRGYSVVNKPTKKTI